MNSKTFNIICNKYESSLRNHITQNFQNFSIISIKQIIINSFFSKFNFGVDELVIYWGCSGNYLNLKIYTFHVVSNIIYWQPTSPDSGEVTVSKIKSNFVWSSSLSETQSKAMCWFVCDTIWAFFCVLRHNDSVCLGKFRWLNGDVTAISYWMLLSERFGSSTCCLYIVKLLFQGVKCLVGRKLFSFLSGILYIKFYLVIVYSWKETIHTNPNTESLFLYLVTVPAVPSAALSKSFPISKFWKWIQL